jgi:hypothetical protein
MIALRVEANAKVLAPMPRSSGVNPVPPVGASQNQLTISLSSVSRERPSSVSSRIGKTMRTPVPRSKGRQPAECVV